MATGSVKNWEPSKHTLPPEPRRTSVQRSVDRPRELDSGSYEQVRNEGRIPTFQLQSACGGASERHYAILEPQNLNESSTASQEATRLSSHHCATNSVRENGRGKHKQQHAFLACSFVIGQKRVPLVMCLLLLSLLVSIGSVIFAAVALTKAGSHSHAKAARPLAGEVNDSSSVQSTNHGQHSKTAGKITLTVWNASRNNSAQISHLNVKYFCLAFGAKKKKR